MAVLCGMNTIQYSARTLPSLLLPAFDDPSVTSLRLSDISVTLRVTYLQFPIHISERRLCADVKSTSASFTDFFPRDAMLERYMLS